MACRTRANRRGIFQSIFSLAALLLVFAASNARAQTGTGALIGTVVDNVTKKPVEGVFVSVSSPALQDQQTASTDAAGLYRIPNLPPGVYFIRFDKDGYFPNEHGDIGVRGDVTLRLNAGLARGNEVETVKIVVRPTVDVGSSTSSTTLDSETIRRVPVSAPGGKGSASRSFESVAELAPTANADLYGTGINGASSPENHYSLDGLSVGNPGKGTVGTQLSTEFVDEVNVVSAGYMPEFGRATGGVLNVVTKSGSNEFHGSVFSYYSPGALEGRRNVPLLDATPVAYAPSLSYIGDVGIDLGGPIIPNKLWFYSGFDISNTKYNIDRSIHRNVNGAIEAAPIDAQTFVADARTIQAMGKLTWAVNPDNRVTVAAYGTPTSSGGGASFDGQNITPGKYAIDPLTGIPEVGGANSPSGTYGATAHYLTSTPLDVSAKWNSQFLDKRLLLDVMLGTHYQKDSVRASDGSSSIDNSGLARFYNVNYRRGEMMGGYHSITEFEKFSNAGRCNEMGADCKVAEYSAGAPRDLNEALYHRYHGAVILSYLATLWGHHLIKAGVDSELTSFENQKSNRVFTESENGSQFNDEERFGTLVAPDTVQFIDPLRKKTSSLTVGGFLQDSWTVFDKVTVNLGLRYDTQYFYNTAGQVGLSLPNQWSPRLGLIYDPTQSGAAKIFVNYARYYENAPLGFADVVLVGEPQIHGGHVCDPNIFSQQLKECQAPANLRANSQDTPREPNSIYTGGGAPNALDPEIAASSSDELSAGGEYEVFRDARLGLTYTRRWLNKWIEDMGPVAGLPGFAGNPGFGLGAAFPKAQRNYQAVTLFMMKNFSRSWLAQASYTLGQLRGNYSGLFASEDFYLGPNGTADFDSPNVENNRYGALPSDIRHTIKVLASRDWQILKRHNLGTGISLLARSGGATSYLGADPFTYPTESYLVERGAGPRLPWTYSADLQVSYRVGLINNVAISLTADVFNLFNFQSVRTVNQELTSSNVVAKPGYAVSALPKPDDKDPTYDGKPIDRNPAYGQATSYQAPRVFRFGLRGQF
jgi:hypothetical protein